MRNKRNAPSEATFYLARRQGGREGKRLRGQPKTMATTMPRHFLPSFAVRRPLIRTDEVEAFLSKAKNSLPGNIDVGIIGGLTIIEQGKMVQQFREVGAEPDPERVEQIAYAISHLLKDTIKSSPRRMELPLGRVFRFGLHNNRLGLVPSGWRGYSSKYARKGNNGERLAHSQIVRETTAVLGGIASAFSEELGSERKVRIAELGSETPHVTFASRSTGGFSRAEERVYADQLQEILPAVISVFDPVIYLRLQQDQEPIVINPRSPGEYRTNGRVNF